MIAHCENAGDRMAILDCPPDMLPQEILEWRMNTAGYDSKFAALYYPWIEVMDPLTNQPMMVPPSGPRRRPVVPHGRHPRRAQGARPTRSSWAPTGSASRSRRPSRAASTRSASTASASFPGRGIRVWGARTLSSDPEWRYINVRRLFNYVSESIMEGTQWSGVRAQRREAVDPAADRGLELPDARRGATGRCSAPRPSRRSTSSATPRPTRPR